MRGSVAQGIRVVVVAALIGLGGGQMHTWPGAASAQAHGAAVGKTTKAETTAELLYQGKILPIVTDVYDSLNNLGSGLSNGSTDQIAQAGDQFADEQQRFEAVKPVPKELRGAASTMNNGLRQLTSGTRALVLAVQASDKNAEQKAATVLEQGIKQFQSAVSQVRQLAGSSTPARSSSGGSAGPVPTPIIKGLP